jgi:hypothetical protein
METKLYLRNTVSVSFVVGGVLLLATFTACNRQPPPLTSAVTPPASAPLPVMPVTPAVAEPPDDYVYYPQYEIYSSRNRQKYAYQHAGIWVWEPVPPQVAVNVLLASPSVPMDFHDSLEKHHAETARNYPQDWSPPVAANVP